MHTHEIRSDAFGHGDRADKGGRPELEALDRASYRKGGCGEWSSECPNPGKGVTLPAFCGPPALMRLRHAVNGDHVLEPPAGSADIDYVESAPVSGDRSGRSHRERSAFGGIPDSPLRRCHWAHGVEMHAGDALYTRVRVAVAMNVGSAASEVGGKQRDATFKAAGEIDIPVHEGNAHPSDGREAISWLP
jgi:hypothetical protein